MNIPTKGNKIGKMKKVEMKKKVKVTSNRELQNVKCSLFEDVKSKLLEFSFLKSILRKKNKTKKSYHIVFSVS